MSQLTDAQHRFFRYVLLLGNRALELGYEPRFGEAWRPPEMAKIYAADGRGSANSLHCDRLAIDLILDRNGKYLAATDDYLPLGLWWEGLSVDCRWGGRFKRADGNHFSLTIDGRA